jgi:hypothetical protein
MNVPACLTRSLALAVLAAVPVASAQTVTTVAGTGVDGYADGPALSASFGQFTGIAVDASGVVYVTQLPTAVRRIGTDGAVSTYSELRDAYFWEPTAIAVAPNGDLFIADRGDCCDGGDVLRFRPGYGPDFYASAPLCDAPEALALGVDALYVADHYAGVSSFTAKGSGNLMDAKVKGSGIAVGLNKSLFVSEAAQNHVVVLADDGEFVVHAGSGHAGFADGVKGVAEFNGPRGLAADAKGNVYVADTFNHSIRRISQDGFVTTLAGNGKPGFRDGDGAVAQFSLPVGVALDAAGNLYVADAGNRRIRKIVLSDGCAACAGRWIVPSAARVAGAAGAFWTSDITIHNKSTEHVVADLRYLGNGDDTRGRPETRVTIPPLGSLSFPDVLSSAFGLDAGFGAVEVVASSSWLSVRSRTSSAGARGSVGDGIPGIPASAFFTQSSSPTPVLIGLREDDAFRSNLVLVNAAAVPITLVAHARDGTGEPIGERSYELPALGMVQDSSFLKRPEFGGAPRPNVSVTITSPSPGASFTVLALVIDNVSNDPTTVLPQ